MKASQNMCRCPCAGDNEGYIWVKEFGDLIGCKLKNQIAIALCGWRTKRQKMLMELIVNCMSDVIGECINIPCPQTRVHRILIVLADRLACWLDHMFELAEKKLAEGRKVEKVRYRGIKSFL